LSKADKKGPVSPEDALHVDASLMGDSHREFSRLLKRLQNNPTLNSRLLKQKKLCEDLNALEGFESMSFLHWCLVTALKFFNLKQKGYDNILKLQIHHNTLYVNQLPEEFNGKKILHLSDLHADCHPGLADKIIELIKPLSYDYCFISGDFRFDKRTLSADSLLPIIKILQAVDAPDRTFGVLGNHDFIQEVPYLEEAGMKFLINESSALDKEGRVFLIGLDDPHTYFADDLTHALKNVPQDACKLLLVHSPELVREAAEKGINLYLCGHTHAGQIRMPFFNYAPIKNCRCSAKYFSGKFQYKNMAGYTNCGAGVSCVPVRFCSPPEIAVHTLSSL